MENEVQKDFKVEDVYGSIHEIVTNKQFIANVKKEVNELKRKRLNRVTLEAGLRYRRDWYDRLNDLGEVTVTFFVNNIEDIWEKRSILNAEIRGVIQTVCEKALRNTLIEYSKLDRV